MIKLTQNWFTHGQPSASVSKREQCLCRTSKKTLGGLKKNLGDLKKNLGDLKKNLGDPKKNLGNFNKA